MRYLLFALLVIAGMLTPVQMAVNKRLAEGVKTPVLAVTMALAIGAAALAMVLFSGVFYRGEIAQAPRVPWWGWVGGLLVAYSVTVEVANTMRGSLGPLMALIIAGNLISAMVIDHHGWLGMRQQPISWWRVVGAVLLVIGAALMQMKSK